MLPQVASPTYNNIHQDESHDIDFGILVVETFFTYLVKLYIGCLLKNLYALHVSKERVLNSFGFITFRCIYALVWICCHGG
jgi:hypothetical protein